MSINYLPSIRRLAADPSSPVSKELGPLYITQDVKWNVIHQPMQSSFYSMVLFWCSCDHCRHYWQWTGVSMGTLVWYATTFPTSSDALCVLTLYAIASINLFNNLHYSSSSIGAHQMAWASLPMQLPYRLSWGAVYRFIFKSSLFAVDLTAPHVLTFATYSEPLY